MIINIPPTMTDLDALDAKIKSFLPPRYQHCYQTVPSRSMGSAKLKTAPDGRIAWGEIWTSFCDLALAGGPPHRGKLLESNNSNDVQDHPDRYRSVCEELCRAIQLTTGFTANEHAVGWIGVDCRTTAAARWLQFAVVAENVTARCDGTMLLLPASPNFQIEKEIKNVVVALAKSFHYWDGHLSESQQSIFQSKDIVEPSTRYQIEANSESYLIQSADIMAGIRRTVSWPIESHVYPGWIGITCPSEEATVWLLRAVAVECVLVRREGTTLYLPVTMENSPTNERTVCVWQNSWQLWNLATE